MENNVTTTVAAESNPVMYHYDGVMSAIKKKLLDDEASVREMLEKAAKEAIQNGEKLRDLSQCTAAICTNDRSEEYSRFIYRLSKANKEWLLKTYGMEVYSRNNYGHSFAYVRPTKATKEAFKAEENALRRDILGQ